MWLFSVIFSLNNATEGFITTHYKVSFSSPKNTGISTYSAQSLARLQPAIYYSIVSDKHVPNAFKSLFHPHVHSL